MKHKYTIIHKDGTVGFVKSYSIEDARIKAAAYDAVLLEDGDSFPRVAETPTKEAVNHPSHYNAHPSGVECITIAEHYNFNVGNAIKYLWRAGLKEDSSLDSAEKELEDVKKALWYVQRHLDNLKKLCNTK